MVSRHGTNLSDGRYKTNIKENVPGLEFIKRLRPVTYTLDMDKLDAALNPSGKSASPRLEHGAPTETTAQDAAAKNSAAQQIRTGFIAQEVEEAAQQSGFDFDGVDKPKNENDMYGLRYSEFVVPLVKAVQEQQQMIEELKKQIEKQQKEIDALKNK